METAGPASRSSPESPPSSLPTQPLRSGSPSPLCHGVTVPRAGRSRVKHQLPRPAACPIPACRAALRCLAPAPPGGPAASSASSAETGEKSSHQSWAATRTGKLQCCPHRLCPHGLEGTRAFSQQDAIADLKAHMWLAEVESSLFQWPCRGAMCAGLPYQLGTLIWVPWMEAVPCQALGTLGGTWRGSSPAMAAPFRGPSPIAGRLPRDTAAPLTPPYATPNPFSLPRLCDKPQSQRQHNWEGQREEGRGLPPRTPRGCGWAISLVTGTKRYPQQSV